MSAMRNTKSGGFDTVGVSFNYFVFLLMTEPNACSTNNGGCAQLCFMMPEATAPTCVCSAGTLRPDKKTCGGNKNMGCGSFTAAKYGTRCSAHEYGMTPKVECCIHAPGIEFYTLLP